MKADPRILYTVMSKIRMMLIAQTGYNIFKAGKTAVRYAVCRRQFANQKGTKQERKLIDYQIHMSTLGYNLANGLVM